MWTQRVLPLIGDGFWGFFGSGIMLWVTDLSWSHGKVDSWVMYVFVSGTLSAACRFQGTSTRRVDLSRWDALLVSFLVACTSHETSATRVDTSLWDAPLVFDLGVWARVWRVWAGMFTSVWFGCVARRTRSVLDSVMVPAAEGFQSTWHFRLGPSLSGTGEGARYRLQRSGANGEKI